MPSTEGPCFTPGGSGGSAAKAAKAASQSAKAANRWRRCMVSSRNVIRGSTRPGARTDARSFGEQAERDAGDLDLLHVEAGAHGEQLDRVVDVVRVERGPDGDARDHVAVRVRAVGELDRILDRRLVALEDREHSAVGVRQRLRNEAPLALLAEAVVLDHGCHAQEEPDELLEQRLAAGGAARAAVARRLEQ